MAGLGLNIARELVSLNLGRMGVSSELGKGSTFSFTLPGNDPAIVLARLLTHLESIDPLAGAFAVLRARPLYPDGNDENLAQLRGFLASCSYSRDVIIGTEDGSELILFGYSSRPHDWHRRLAKAGAEIEQFSASQKLGAFTVELVDTLAYPVDLHRALPMLLAQLRPEALHV